MGTEGLARLINSVSDSLQREMHAGFDRIDSRLNRIEVRLERQGGILQAGVRSHARMVQWSESVDQLLADRDARLDSLERRISDLESRQ